MAQTRRPVFRVSAQTSQALAWEVSDIGGGLTIVDKPGGIDNASAYIGLVPERRIGLVVLVNRGDRNPHALARSVILPGLVRLSTLSH
jgi:beta-lactamase class C